MIYFIKLLRPLNLLIIAAVMYAMRYVFYNFNQDLFFKLNGTINEIDFFLLVISTLIIAAAGNIINDYFDMRIDRINKPEKVIVGKHIKKRVAMLAHVIMNIIAVLTGIYLSYKYNTFLPVSIHLLTTTLLWLYSVSLKRQFLTGNLSIAFLSALVPYLSGMIHLYVLKEQNMQYFTELNLYLYKLIIYTYMVFAFLTTLIREIQKDMADMKGDAAIGCKTVPLVWGVEKTKKISIYLILLAFFAVLTLLLLKSFKLITIVFASLSILLPFIYSAILTHKAKQRKDFLLASTLIKISMVGGILFIIISYAA